MKIWIDTRAAAQSQYYRFFIKELIEELLLIPSEHQFIIYREEWDELFWSLSTDNLPEHITLKTLSKNLTSLLWSIKAKKIFESEKFHMMIFFDAHVPHGYTHPYITILESLKEVFFPKKKWLERKIFSYKLKRAMKHCFTCICLDPYSPLELNEHLDISEESLWCISWFFPKLQKIPQSLEIDVKLKHNIKNPYFIYDSGNEVHNNFERILKSIKKLKDMWNPVHLIISCDETSSDLDVREKVIEYDISANILFLWKLEEKFEASYYAQSHGVIYSSIYESFPLHFSKALHYKKTILANNIRTHSEVMWATVEYLDPLSVHTMTETLREQSQKELSETNQNYASITRQLSAKKTLTELLTYIES